VTDRPSSKRNPLLIALAVVVLAAAALALAVLFDRPDDEEPVVDRDLASPDPDEDWEWLLDDPSPTREPSGEIEPRNARDPGFGERRYGRSERRRGRGDGGVDRGRGRGQRFRDPARRAEWLRERTQIRSLGQAEPEISPEQVWEGFRSARPAMRECIQQAGGFEALREQSPEGRPRRRTMTVDIGADGRVLPGSASIDPAPSGDLAECMQAALESASFEGTGPDGAQASLSFGGRDRGRPSGRRGDAGQSRGPVPLPPPVMVEAPR
jgi:hypothetical protein